MIYHFPPLRFFFFSIIATSLSFALDENDNLFLNDIDTYDINDNIFQDSPPPITFDESDLLAFDSTVFSLFNVDADPDESNNINLLADCLQPPGNQLGARDEEQPQQQPQKTAQKRNDFCPPNNNIQPATAPPTIPQLQFPTLDNLRPQTPRDDQTEKRLPLVGYSAAIVVKPDDPRAKNVHICPPYRIFYLCCLCDISTHLSTSCFDCLPS